MSRDTRFELGRLSRGIWPSFCLKESTSSFQISVSGSTIHAGGAHFVGLVQGIHHVFKGGIGALNQLSAFDVEDALLQELPTATTKTGARS